MKSMYYHPQKVSTHSLLALAVASVVVLAAIEVAPQPESALRNEQMIRAASATDTGFRAIQDHRRQLGIRNLSIHDPASTGMLGPSMSLVTSLPGHLDAKQTSVNANFGAVIRPPSIS